MYKSTSPSPPIILTHTHAHATCTPLEPWVAVYGIDPMTTRFAPQQGKTLRVLFCFVFCSLSFVLFFGSIPTNIRCSLPFSHASMRPCIYASMHLCVHDIGTALHDWIDARYEQIVFSVQLTLTCFMLESLEFSSFSSFFLVDTNPAHRVRLLPQLDRMIGLHHMYENKKERECTKCTHQNSELLKSSIVHLFSSFTETQHHCEPHRTAPHRTLNHISHCAICETNHWIISVVLQFCNCHVFQLRWNCHSFVTSSPSAETLFEFFETYTYRFKIYRWWSKINETPPRDCLCKLCLHTFTLEFGLTCDLTDLLLHSPDLSLNLLLCHHDQLPNCPI